MKSWPEWRLKAGFDEWMESPQAQGLHLVITREILTKRLEFLPSDSNSCFPEEHDRKALPKIKRLCRSFVYGMNWEGHPEAISG